MSGKWNRPLLTIAGVLLLGCLPGGLYGQTDDQETPDGDAKAETSRPTNSAVQLKDGLIQPDQRVWIAERDGRAVLQYSLDDLRDLERIRREATQMPALLESADLKIQVGEASADVQVDLLAQSGMHGAIQPFNVGLKSCQLVESPKFVAKDTAESLRQVELDTGIQTQQQVVPTVDGYQWLLLAPESTKHQLSLVAKTMVDRSTDRHSIAIDLPLVNTTVALDLPPNATEERVQDEDMVVSRVANEKSVHLEIRSRGGPFTISWRNESGGHRAGAIEAKSDTVYEPFDLLSSLQAWSVTTSINIRWSAADGSHKVVIKLPPGGQWSNVPYSEVERIRWTKQPVAPDPTAESDQTPADVLVVENLDPASFSSVDNLVLEWRWQPNSTPSDSAPTKFNLLAPEIEGVDTHVGSISAVYPSRFEFSYAERPGTSFVEHNRSTELTQGRDQIQFSFNQPKAGFDVTFQKEQQFPTVRPIYRIHVGEERIELTAWLRCWFDGGPNELGLVAGDWTLDEGASNLLREANNPESLNFEALSVQRREDGSYSLSSRESESGANSLRSEQVWRLFAYRELSSDSTAKNIEFQLPAIQRGSLAPEYGSGILLVTSDDYLLLQPEQARCTGLWPEVFLPEYQSYVRPRMRPPQLFRFQSQGAAPTWIGRIASLPQLVRVNHQAEVDVASDRIQIAQQFDLRVTNRPLSQVRFRIREDVAPAQVYVDDQLLPYEEMPTEVASATSVDTDGGPNWKEIRLVGVREILGPAKVTVRTSLAFASPEATDQSATHNWEASIPLVQLISPSSNQPIENSDGNHLLLKQSSNFRIFETSRGDMPGPLELKPDQSSIRCTFEWRNTQVGNRPITRGTWLQTLLTGNERRDRFVARVQSPIKQVTVRLPDHAVVDRVALDGVQLGNDAAPYDYNTNQIMVALPDESEHVVEVIYLLSEPLVWATRLRMTPAGVVDSEARDRFYWQLVTPAVYHLGWCPAKVTAEWRWQWRTLWWERASSLDQPDLEQWIGAASLTRFPSATNSYVMSGIEQFPTMDVWILSRFAFWLPMGAFAIALALLVIHLPAVRTPNSLVFSAAVVAGLSALWPDMAVLLGQTAIITLSLVAAVGLTQAAIEARVGRRSIFSSRMRSRSDRSDSAFSGTSSRPSSASVTSTPLASAAQSNGVE